MKITKIRSVARFIALCLVALSLPGCASQPAASSDRVEAPRVVQRVEADYPFVLRQQGIEGKVVIAGTVPKEGGTLRNPRVVRSDHPGLNQPALDAVSRWVWAAFSMNGEAVDVEFETTVTFSVR